MQPIITKIVGSDLQIVLTEGHVDSGNAGELKEVLKNLLLDDVNRVVFDLGSTSQATTALFDALDSFIARCAESRIQVVANKYQTNIRALFNAYYPGHVDFT